MLYFSLTCKMQSLYYENNRDFGRYNMGQEGSSLRRHVPLYFYLEFLWHMSQWLLPYVAVDMCFLHFTSYSFLNPLQSVFLSVTWPVTSIMLNLTDTSQVSSYLTLDSSFYRFMYSHFLVLFMLVLLQNPFTFKGRSVDSAWKNLQCQGIWVFCMHRMHSSS